MSALANSPSEWRAVLELAFQRRYQRTVLARRRHHGPLAVQRAFYPEGAPCHVYVLHPPGGIVGGDQLEISIEVERGAHALLTTPASGKFYRSDGRLAGQRNHLRVESGAALEWLPQDTILFNGCRAEMQTRIDLQADSRFIGWEILTLGRCAANEVYETGDVTQDIELWMQERPVLIERLRLCGGAEMLDASWGLQGRPVTGTLLATPSDPQQLAAVRVLMEQLSQIHVQTLAVTLVDGVLVCRGLANDARALHESFERIWRVVRPAMLGREACRPRVWNT